MKPARMEVIEPEIPPGLKQDRNWIVWRWEQRQDKWTKPPYQITGALAKSDDPGTWTDFETAYQTYRNGGGWDGIGYMLNGQYTGIDWDDCVNDHGEIEPDVLRLIEAVDSYTERSPSGKGFKTLLRGRLPAGGHHGEKIGVFDTGRYFCITGQRIVEASRRIESRQERLNDLVRRFWPKDFNPPPEPPPRQRPPMPTDLSDQHIIEKAKTANDGGKFGRLYDGDWSDYPSRSEADQALCCKLAFWTGRDAARIDAMFRASGLMRPKWERDDYRQRTIERAIELSGETYEQKTDRPHPKGDNKENPPTDAPECYLELLTESDADSNDTYEWLIPQLVPKGQPMIIGGKGGSGKSTQALEFAAQIMESDPEVGVVYICAEGTYRDTKIKARQMGLFKFGRFFFMKRKNKGTAFKLSEKEDLPMVTQALEAANKAGHKIGFVVIDSIRGMHRGNLNDDAVGEVMQAVNAEISERLGVTVCYIHHANKGIKDAAAMDLFLGSVTIVNAIRHGLFMTKKTNRMRELEVAKSNLGIDDIFFNAELTPEGRVKLTHVGIRGEDSSPIDESQVDRAEEIVLSMLQATGEAAVFKIYERAELEGISVETVRRAKNLRGDIDTHKKGKVWYWRRRDP